jgi:hypothetical protein
MDVRNAGTAPTSLVTPTPEKGTIVKYMLMLYSCQQDYDALAGKAAPGKPAWTPEQFEAMGRFMAEFSGDLATAGELVEARGLSAPVHARRITLKEGVPVVTDGPYPETQEVLAGYWVVDCDGFDRATEIAVRLSGCPNPGLAYAEYKVDIRPVVDSRTEL